MTCAGSKNSRAKQALRNIGPAVLNGGFSTFISISLLARSQSLAFISFYKVKILKLVATFSFSKTPKLLCLHLIF